MKPLKSVIESLNEGQTRDLLPLNFLFGPLGDRTRRSHSKEWSTGLQVRRSEKYPKFHGMGKVIHEVSSSQILKKDPQVWSIL